VGLSLVVLLRCMNAWCSQKNENENENARTGSSSTTGAGPCKSHRRSFSRGSWTSGTRQEAFR